MSEGTMVGAILALLVVGIVCFSFVLGGLSKGTDVKKQCETFQATTFMTTDGEAFFYCYREPKK